MKGSIAIALLALMLAAGCGKPPQYTVLGQGQKQAVQSSSPAGPQSWPDVNKPPPATKKTPGVAVIVAIEDYAFLPDVPGAIENANAWESWFRKTRGFDDVYVLTNKKAPVEEIERFVKQATSTVPAGGSLWFVFIGHGAPLQDGSDGALIGMDAQQTIASIGSRSLPRKKLLAMLSRGKQTKTVVVLDACFSGRDSEGKLLAQGTQPVIPVSDAPHVNSKTVVLSAAANDEVAGELPGAQRPAFSYLLLGALRGWADDGDGKVTAKEAVDWTRQELRYVSGRQQTPGADGDEALELATSATEHDPGIDVLMKNDGKNPVAAAPQKPANDDASNGQGGTRIDTNQGLVFVKPDEWGVGPAGMGVILTLANQYDGAQIMVSKHKVRQAWAANAFPAPMDAKQIEAPAMKKFASTSGKMAVYETTDPNFGTQRSVVFDTYQHGAAWRFVLQLNEKSNAEADRKAFEKFLAGVQFN